MIITRLEQVKKTFGDKYIHSDIKWLIEQADKAEKYRFYSLEKAEEENKKFRAEIMRVHVYEKMYKDLLGFASSVEEKQELEIKRLREALEKMEHVHSGIYLQDAEIMKKIARIALEDSK